ncbi:DNA-binding protein [Micromonospora sp. WP24]|uniref:helix-turn-helix transcriptional regulator n=1 Tax=unclassified Micromonospora TaxID=2617518 RepID=UPI0010470726|nr:MULTISPECIES: DNA-binding protein [unclassified Micromonospora]TDC28133.1 DNA-binding protein [Micromonospora sp. 15K316]TYB99081.1 DNA-binding protein [Micromonospora sp. WP24]
MVRRLYGSAELQERLGVSRARIVQITGRPDFPPPFDRLAGGAVWLVEDVEAWISEHRPWQAQGTNPDES